MPISTYELPQWCKEAKKALVERNMTLTDLAEELNCSRRHISAVMNARVRSSGMRDRICEHLDIRIPSVR